MITLSEIQTAIDLNLKAGRILSLMRGVRLKMNLLQSREVVDVKLAIYIHQLERLEYIYDTIVDKIAEVTITSRLAL